MITVTDFITLPYTPDLTRGGIAYACKSLPYTYNRMGSSVTERLRRIVAGIGVELAFRRYLTQNKIPHDNLGATPFTDPDRYDIAIGGRRCDIKSFILNRKKRIQLVQKQPKKLLEAQALVPSDQIVSRHLSDEDIYIFTFLSALLTPNRRDVQKAIKADQPIYLIFPLPQTWANPKTWTSLGELAVKSDASHPVDIELWGQNNGQASQSEQMTLEPGERTTAQEEFYSLQYLHIPNLPDGLIGIHSPSLNDTQVVEPLQWGNIWVYGIEMVFTGFITRGKFRARAHPLPAGSTVFQYARTSTDNLSLPIQELQPLPELFDQARKWQGK